MRLHVTADGADRSFPVRNGEVSIGSGEDNAIHLDVVGVSNKHAIVRRDGNRVVLSDAGSKNGIVVNGRRVPEIVLLKGLRVQLGRAVVWLDDAPSDDVRKGITVVGKRARKQRTAETEEAGGWSNAIDLLARLSALRRIDRPVRNELMNGLRHVLNADAVAIVRREGKETLYEALSGDIDTSAIVDALLASSESSVQLGQISAIVQRDGSSRAFFATLPGRGRRLSQWQWTTFSAVANRLLGLTVDPVRSVVQQDTPSRVIQSKSTKDLIRRIRALAPTNHPILLLGETGSGKTFFAEVIHDLSGRRGKFRPLNGADYLQSLLASTLFGIEAGVATNVRESEGLIADIDHGTVFFDDVDLLREEGQGHLLRFIETGEIRPLGSKRVRRVDVRVLAATNKPDEVREDLLFRFTGGALNVPPLRERREEIPMLIEAAIAEEATGELTVTASAVDFLRAQDWPGNARQLKHVVRRAVAMKGGAGIIDDETVAQEVELLSGKSTAVQFSTLREARASVDRRMLEDALMRCKGDKTKAARELAIAPNTLRKLLRDHDLDA